MNDPRLNPLLSPHEPAKLRAVANHIAARLVETDGVIGVTLAGSLAEGRAGPRSDVDLVAIGVSGEASSWPMEHRLLAGVRVDVEWCAMDALEALALARRIDAVHLRSRHGVSPGLLVALVRSSSPPPLADPTGALSGVREALQERLTVAQIAAPRLAAHAEALGTGALMAARTALMDRGPGPALIRVGWAIEQFAAVLRAFPDEGEPGEEDHIAALHDIDLGVRPRIEAARAYWQRALALGAVLLGDRLRAIGIENPSGLCLVGEPLFYEAHEPTEIGRALTDTDLALAWAHDELEARQPWRALRRLWFAGFPTPFPSEGSFPQPVTERWPALGRALAASGCDVGTAIHRVTEDPELAALGETMAARGTAVPRASATAAQLAIGTAERLFIRARQRAVRAVLG